MQSKRILSVFLLSALLLLSACARQNSDPIVSTSSSCRAETSAEPVSPWIEPAEAASIGDWKGALNSIREAGSESATRLARPASGRRGPGPGW